MKKISIIGIIAFLFLALITIIYYYRIKNKEIWEIQKKEYFEVLRARDFISEKLARLKEIGDSLAIDAAAFQDESYVHDALHTMAFPVWLERAGEHRLRSGRPGPSPPPP